MLGRRLDALLAAVGFTALAHPAATQETAVAEVAAGPQREGDELVRVRLRAERLVWGTSLLA